MITFPKKRYILTKKQPPSGSVPYSAPGTIIIQGLWDASGNVFPSTGATTSVIMKGYQWKINVVGVLAGQSVVVGDKITAWADVPGQVLTNWDIT